MPSIVPGSPNAPGTSFLTAATADETYSLIGTAVHGVRRSDVKRSKGGVIGTSGKPVISWRCDHGVDGFRTSLWPVLKAAFMPCGLGVVTDSIDNATADYEPSTTTWEQVRTMHLEGCEIWSHSRTHRDPAPLGIGDYTIEEEIVGSRDKLVTEYLTPVGWHTPGITNPSTLGYSSDLNTVAEMGSTEAGQLIMANYGLWEVPRSDSQGTYRVMPTDGCEMLAHVTIDSLSLAAAQGLVDRIITYGFGCNLMFHGAYIGTNGYMSVADFTSLVDYVETARDAGDVEVLSPSGLAFADPNSTSRLNLVRDSTFEGLTKSGATIGQWTCTTDAGISLGTDGGHAGSNYIRFSGTTNLLEQDHSYMGTGGFRNSAFRMTAWVRNPSGLSGRVAVMLVGVGSPGGYPELASARTLTFALPSTTAWTFIQFPFCFPGNPLVEGLKCRIARHSSSSGDVDFDDVRIEPI